MRTYLVTGGAGFIGSNFIRCMLAEHDDVSLINLDALTYAGNLESLSDIDGKYDDRYEFVKGDITHEEHMNALFAEKKPDVVVNFAAESHNDRAVLDPGIFIRTNVMGTQILLGAARNSGVSRFHHISTCEVFGDLPLDSDEMFREDSRYAPRTPYNASKAGADHVVMAYYHTFGIPITITNCSNNYGPYQFPEKLIPLFASNALEGKSLPLFKSSQNKREWLHVIDHCRAIVTC
ncbi:dTDP-glucose 4,6-dehydratase, partial [Candidatus Hydrogenedentota bacterium]